MRRIKIFLMGIAAGLLGKQKQMAEIEKVRKESLIKELTRLNSDMNVKQINTGSL